MKEIIGNLKFLFQNPAGTVCFFAFYSEEDRILNVMSGKQVGKAVINMS